MKKSIYLKLGIFVLVVLLIYGMCGVFFNDGSGFRKYHGIYYLGDSSLIFIQNLHLHKDSLIEMLKLNPNVGVRNHFEYLFLCNGEMITINFLINSESDEVYDIWISGKENADEYDSLTKIYQQCYESEILSKLK